MAGLALVHVLGLSGVLQWMVRQTSEAENTMTSVERMLEYTRLPQVCVFFVMTLVYWWFFCDDFGVLVIFMLSVVFTYPRVFVLLVF